MTRLQSALVLITFQHNGAIHVIYANRGCYKLIETIFDLGESVDLMRSRCILFLELHLSIIPQRVQSAPSVTKCGSAISATLVHTSSKFIGFQFITQDHGTRLILKSLALHEIYWFRTGG